VHYVPDWEPLANALKRVLSTGSKEPDAKANICKAVADRKIAVRVLVDKSKAMSEARRFMPPMSRCHRD
jgi:hypothetical protein